MGIYGQKKNTTAHYVHSTDELKTASQNIKLQTFVDSFRSQYVIKALSETFA